VVKLDEYLTVKSHYKDLTVIMCIAISQVRKSPFTSGTLVCQSWTSSSLQRSTSISSSLLSTSSFQLARERMTTVARGYVGYPRSFLGSSVIRRFGSDRLFFGHDVMTDCEFFCTTVVVCNLCDSDKDTTNIILYTFEKSLS
jgi:hypothetical protein